MKGWKVMRNLNKFTLIARNGKYGLEIYLVCGRDEFHIATRRSNGLLYSRLKHSVKLVELKRTKTKYTPAQQKYHHITQSLCKLAEDFINCELVVK